MCSGLPCRKPSLNQGQNIVLQELHKFTFIVSRSKNHAVYPQLPQFLSSMFQKPCESYCVHDSLEFRSITGIRLAEALRLKRNRGPLLIQELDRNASARRVNNGSGHIQSLPTLTTVQQTSTLVRLQGTPTPPGFRV